MRLAFSRVVWAKMLAQRNARAASHSASTQVGQSLEHMSFGERSKFFNATMDQLPSPSGVWATEFAKRNAKYNLHMFFSTAAMVATVLLAFKLGCLEFAIPDEKKGFKEFKARLEETKLKASAGQH